MGEERKYAPQSYYADGDRENTAVSFFVNCAGEVVIRKKFRTVSEKGRNDYYLMYMQSGCLAAEIGGQPMRLLPGEMLCIRPHTPYRYDNAESADPIRYYWIHFTGRDCEQILAACALPLCRVCDVGIDYRIAAGMEELFSEFRSRRENFFFSAALRVQYMLLELAARSDAGGDRERERLDRSIRYIHTHIAQPLSVKALAEMEFFSPSRYRELFRQTTGLSPIEYITHQRIHLACDLLAQGSPGLSRVAELCGYRDRLYFQRVFKKQTGLTPGEYRARQH